MTDNFKGYPLSLTEIRSDKTSRANDWTPRDALISTLRKLDSGEISPNHLMVIWSQPSKEPGYFDACAYALSSPDVYRAIGMLEKAKLDMWKP